MPTLRRTLTLLVPVLAATTLSGALAAPCAACSCAPPGTPAQSAARADAVVVGTVVESRRDVVLTRADGVQVVVDVLVLEVSEVRKGTAPVRTEVVAPGGASTCDLRLVPGVTYLVMAQSSGLGLRANPCNGSRPVSAVTPAELDLVGPAREPIGVADAVDPPSGADSPSGSGRVSDPTVAVAVGTGLGAVVLGAALLVRHRRRMDAEDAVR
jgi:hypothetical protein